MIKVYVAGPYTKGDVAVNVKNAIDAANELANLGFAPFVPHLVHFWHLSHPRSYQFWCDLDNEYVKVCQALLRLPGESLGSDAEVALAESLNIPVFYSIQELTFGLSPKKDWIVDSKKVEGDPKAHKITIQGPNRELLESVILSMRHENSDPVEITINGEKIKKQARELMSFYDIVMIAFGIKGIEYAIEHYSSASVVYTNYGDFNESGILNSTDGLHACHGMRISVAMTNCA